MSDKKEDNMERKVFEVRRTVMQPKISSDKFVFEKHDDEWHIHFAAATHYSLTQIKEIVEILKELPAKGENISIEE